jgi:hypothetical protein
LTSLDSSYKFDLRWTNNPCRPSWTTEEIMSPVLAISLLISLQAPGPSADPPANPPANSDVRRVPDDKWVPEPGDTAEIYSKDGSDIIAAFDIFAYGDLIKAGIANDIDGVRELGKQRRVGNIPDETPVLVIEAHDNPFIAPGPFLELRIIDGQYKGLKIFAPNYWVARVVRIPKPVQQVRTVRPETPAEKNARIKAEARDRLWVEQLLRQAKAREDQDKAASLLRLGQTLEKSGAIKGALSYYRETIEKYPQTPPAKTAAERVKMLEAPQPDR